MTAGEGAETARERGEIAAAEPPEPTLAHVVSTLGAGIIEVLRAPRSLGVAARQATIHDPRFPPSIEAGDVVLAVGVAADAASDLVREAGARGAAAVALKLSDPPPSSLLDAADAAGVAVLAVPAAMGWAQCLSLLRTAMAGAGALVAGDTRVGDLFGFANAVAAMVGGAVTIEDPHSRVLAYSSIDEPIDGPRRDTILGRRIPDPWMKRLREAGVFRRLWAADDVVRFEYPSEDLRPRLAVAVRAGGEILGSIWVAEGRAPFDERAEAALREAAKLAALHLIRHRTTEDVDRQMRADLLRSVLDGRWPPELVGERLGVAPDEPHAVVAFEPEGDEEGALALQRERTLDVVTVYCEAFRRRAAAAAVGAVVYTLLPMGGGTTRERLRAFARDVVEQAARGIGVRLRVGIGSTVATLREAPKSRWEADQALRVARSAGAMRPIADIEDVRGEALLIELRDVAADRPHLRAGKLERLIEHDRRHGTDYVASLRAYLDTLGDVPRAAELVRVHPNTFRYRLKRLAELAGLDLDDSRERLAVQIQLEFFER